MRRRLSIVLLAALTISVGCSATEPSSSRSEDTLVVVSAERLTPAAPVLDVRVSERDDAGDVASPLVTVAPAPTPSSQLAGSALPAPTVPSTRAVTPSSVGSSSVVPSSVSQTTAGPTSSSPPPTQSSTTQPSTTQSSTTLAPTQPPTTQPASGIVEFRIRAGTGAAAWNSFDDPLRVTVGQVVRVHNDDSVTHTLHATGVPFEHGPSIPPGGFADHPVLAPSTPDPAAPVTYDHDAGSRAPFWVVASGPDGGSAPPGTDELAAAEAESLRLLNRLRADLGLQRVSQTDDEMHAFARSWALEMRTTGFRHSDPPRWFENIVWYSDETMTPAEAAAQFHDMWVNSAGHYRNMTNPEWSIVGVGMWHDETGWWGVHVFR